MTNAWRVSSQAGREQRAAQRADSAQRSAGEWRHAGGTEGTHESITFVEPAPPGQRHGDSPFDATHVPHHQLHPLLPSAGWGGAIGPGNRADR